VLFRSLFVEYIEKPNRDEKYSMVLDRGSTRNLAPGPMTQTGNTLDVALEGDGYFAVDTLNGPRYTRSGNFAMDSNRTLTNSSGLPVLDENGTQMTLPVGAREIRITPEGEVSTERGPVGKLQIVKFAREQFMEQIGGGLYTTAERPIPVEEGETKVRQGFLEGSNVQSIREMTTMTEISRQYESIQRLMQTDHERLRNAYAKLTKLS